MGAGWLLAGLTFLSAVSGGSGGGDVGLGMAWMLIFLAALFACVTALVGAVVATFALRSGRPAPHARLGRAMATGTLIMLAAGIAFLSLH